MYAAILPRIIVMGINLYFFCANQTLSLTFFFSSFFWSCSVTFWYHHRGCCRCFEVVLLNCFPRFSLPRKKKKQRQQNNYFIASCSFLSSSLASVCRAGRKKTRTQTVSPFASLVLGHKAPCILSSSLPPFLLCYPAALIDILLYGLWFIVRRGEKFGEQGKGGWAFPAGYRVAFFGVFACGEKK